VGQGLAACVAFEVFGVMPFNMDVIFEKGDHLSRIEHAFSSF